VVGDLLASDVVQLLRMDYYIFLKKLMASVSNSIKEVIEEDRWSAHF
jgi:hypothetical protein